MHRLTEDDARATLRETNRTRGFPWLVWGCLAFTALCWWGIVWWWPW